MFETGPATLGHLSFLSAVPSPSVSGQPLSSLEPLSLGQASTLSAIPSPSVSGQPLNSGVPFTLGQTSNLFSIPSPSESGQPLSSLVPFSSAHLSSASKIPSPSVSAGQPKLSTYLRYFASVPLQRSYLSGTPSSSVSFMRFGPRPEPPIPSVREKATPMLL